MDNSLGAGPFEQGTSYESIPTASQTDRAYVSSLIVVERRSVCPVGVVELDEFEQRGLVV